MIFKTLLAKGAQFVVRNKGLLMTLAAGAFEVAAVCVTAKQAVKAEKVLIPANEKINQLKKEMDDVELILNKKVDIKEHKKQIRHIQRETFVKLAKIYSLPFIFTGLSLTCMGGSYKVMRDKQIALLGAYATLDKSFKTYRERVKAKFGEDAEKDIYQNATYANKTSVNPETGEVEVSENLDRVIRDGGAYSIIFDASCAAYARNGRVNWNTLINIQEQLNLDLRRHGYLFLNEVFDALGVDKNTIDKDLVAASRVVGWIYNPADPNRSSWVSLGISDIHGEPNEIGKDLFNNYEHDAILSLNPDGVIAFDKVDNAGNKIKGFTHFLIS